LYAKLMIIPLGGDAESETAEENVPEERIVSVPVTVDPCVNVTVDGESEMLKSPTPVPICIPTFVLADKEPLVPTTDSTKLPTEAPGAAERVSVPDAIPPLGGVSVPGPEIVMPVGAGPTQAV
jgi:hypothetical protein